MGPKGEITVFKKMHPLRIIFESGDSDGRAYILISIIHVKFLIKIVSLKSFDREEKHAVKMIPKINENTKLMHQS